LAHHKQSFHSKAENARKELWRILRHKSGAEASELNAFLLKSGISDQEMLAAYGRMKNGFSLNPEVKKNDAISQFSNRGATEPRMSQNEMGPAAGKSEVRALREKVEWLRLVCSNYSLENLGQELRKAEMSLYGEGVAILTFQKAKDAFDGIQRRVRLALPMTQESALEKAGNLISRIGKTPRYWSDKYWDVTNLQKFVPELKKGVSAVKLGEIADKLIEIEGRVLWAENADESNRYLPSFNSFDTFSRRRYW